MAPVCCGHAGPPNVPTVLDWLRKFQDGDVVFKGVAVPSGVLYDPEANSVSWGSKDPAFSWLGRVYIALESLRYRATNYLRMETSTAWAPSDEVLMS